MGASITIIVTPADDEEAFESMTVDERRRNGHEWEEFPLRSGRLLETFFMEATGSDLTVIACEDRKREGIVLVTRVLVKDVVADVIPDLMGLLDENADSTSRALQKHGSGTSELARIFSALRFGTWPESGDPAEEAAAFARQLLKHAVLAKDAGMGVCWEYRGKVAAAPLGS